MRLRIIKLMGSIANLAGYPAVLRRGEHSPTVATATVRVRCSDLYTVVSVGNVDVYFTRLTGKYDGVGSAVCGADCGPPVDRRHHHV